jgi:hypothetical protein
MERRRLQNAYNGAVILFDLMQVRKAAGKELEFLNKIQAITMCLTTKCPTAGQRRQTDRFPSARFTIADPWITSRPPCSQKHAELFGTLLTGYLPKYASA